MSGFFFTCSPPIHGSVRSGPIYPDLVGYYVGVTKYVRNENVWRTNVLLITNGGLITWRVKTNGEYVFFHTDYARIRIFMQNIEFNAHTHKIMKGDHWLNHAVFTAFFHTTSELAQRIFTKIHGYILCIHSSPQNALPFAPLLPCVQWGRSSTSYQHTGLSRNNVKPLISAPLYSFKRTYHVEKKPLMKVEFDK